MLNTPRHNSYAFFSSSHKNDPMPIILMLATSINLMGCVEVIYRVYCKKCKIGKYQSLPLDSKFSLYFVIPNVLFATIQLVDMILTVTNTIKPGIICDVAGKISPSFLTLNLLSILSFTHLFYLKICKNINMDEETGKYDWKIWQSLFLISWVVSIFGLNRYDYQDLWCANRPQGDSIFLANIGFIIGILIVTLAIYFKLLNKNEDHVSEICIVEPIHPLIIRNVASYLLVFFLQWICVLIYNLSKLHEINDESTKKYFTTLLILGVNFGGFGNAIVYIINEYRTHIEESSIIYNINIPKEVCKSYGSFA